MAKSPTFNDGRPILVDLVTEKTRISSMLLMNKSMKNFVKPWDAVFQNFAPPRLDDKKMELGFIKPTGKKKRLKVRILGVVFDGSKFVLMIRLLNYLLAY